jgi:glycine/serine hydroxymethyltransferase
MEDLKKKARELASRVVRNNLWRQRECFNLIPSETTPSILVKVCEISDPAGRYAEHRSMRGEEVYFYQGTGFIRDVESELKEELSRFFGAPHIEVRPISGQMANEVVFKAMVKCVNEGRGRDEQFRRMAGVMNNHLSLGGHLSAQPMGSLFNFVDLDSSTGRERVINFPVRPEDPYAIDTNEMARLIRQEEPDLIVFGKSMFLYHEPVREAVEAARGLEPRPVIMYDMAHVLGLYGAFQAPITEGADVVTGSTHKTFYGPQRGVVVSASSQESKGGSLWKNIVNRAFPGSTSNHHLGSLLALLVAAYEMNTFKDAYQSQVIRNARAFAHALSDSGLQVEGDPARDFTETHQVLLRVDRFGSGTEIAQWLEDNNIITNYQALPGDESFLTPSGIRIGVQEMTRFGMVEEDFGGLAEIIADVIMQRKNTKKEVMGYRKRFREMRYTLPPDDGAELAAQVLCSVMPDSDYAKRFSEMLVRVARDIGSKEIPPCNTAD